MANAGVLGSTLVPEMEKRGYKKPMSLGPILGSSGLSIMIPPTTLGVLLGAVGEISIGKIMVGIILPGLLMASFYATYIITRCWLQPSIAPPYQVPPIPLKEKLVDTARYILPVGFVLFMVVGLIFLGVATPSEAAATGTLSTFILAAAHRKLSWPVIKKSVSSAVQLSVMVLLIIAGASILGQLMAYTGATEGLINFVTGLAATPVLILIAMQVVLLIMGTFLDQAPIIMIAIPLFMPIVNSIGYNPLVFAIISLLNMEIATTSPPFGMTLFVMKGVAPPDTTMGDIYRAGLPFIGLDLIVMALLIAFPQMALWLPNLMIRH